MNRQHFVTALIVAAVATTGSTLRARAAKTSEPVELTASGEELFAQYSAALAELQAEITKALPVVNEQKKAAYLQAREAEKAAEADWNAAKDALGKVATAQALVNHALGKWIGGADRGIAEATAKLEAATTDAERKAAQEELAKWQQNRQDGVNALKERQAVLDQAKRDEPRLLQERDGAEAAFAKAKAHTLKMVDALDLGSFLSSSKLDAKLAKHTVLFEATPRGLAEFAQQGKQQRKLVEQLLADADLMLQMAMADGAKNGKYGQAMALYTDIQKASQKAGEGVLRRLALAISLEHATPISQRNAVARTDAPETVNPVNRYLHYEKAFLDGELDPGFKNLTAWDLRMVVNGNEPDETLAWGREMLRNYRPDHITTDDYNWRYVAAVRTDIRYGSQDNQYDKPELQFFQNILMNGGVCGRRAFFGRFILRAFGVPTLARPQRGHAALAHWTPDGWVVCLGGGWGCGWVSNRNKDLDYLAITQARNNHEAYRQVKRAQWIGDVVGEPRTFGFLSGSPAFWNGVALYTQRAIIEEGKAVALAAVGEELGEANESDVEYAMEIATVTEADRRITVDPDGVISIPAVACSNPTSSTGKIIFMPSVLGGMQMHYNRTGDPETFEYTFDAPAAGKFALTARVVTPSWQQHLLVAANGAKELVDIALPHTVGMWEETEPVEINLVEGKNVLRFSHKSDGYEKGVTIKDFTLTPVK
jgi:hypothetical protein